MKSILYFFFLVTTVFAQQGDWIKIQTPVTANLKLIYAIDSLNIWVAGDSGYILNTTDMGLNWSVQHSNENFRITDIFFLDKYNGWAIENGSIDGINVINNILSTTDGGSNWQSSVFRPDNVNLYSICFIDEQTGFIGGDNSLFVITTNRGVDWNELPRDTATFSHFPIHKIRFINDSVGFAVGGIFDRGGVIWHCTDRGFTWLTDSAYADPFFDMAFVNDQTVIAIASDIERSFPSAVFRTSDLGNSWFYEEIPYYGVSRGIDKRTPTEIWGTFQKEFIISTDGGDNWFTIITPDSIEVYDISFTDSLHGFVAAQNGLFLRYLPKVVSVSENYLSTVNSFITVQNFPNPFNSTSIIRLILPEKNYVKISVYNSIGEKIKVLFEGFLTEGISEHNFNSENLSSGNYYYSVEVSDEKNKIIRNVFTGKMTLLK